MLHQKTELENLCKEIALKYWGLEFNLPVYVNPRLKRTWGLIHSKYIRNEYGKVIGREPTRIEVSSKSYNTLTKVQMYDLLKHEVCHYACMVMRKPFSDGTVFFESELKRIGATSSRTNFNKEVSKKFQDNIINRKQNRKKANFRYIKISDQHYKVYKGLTFLGEVKKVSNYGKFTWKPITPVRDYGNLCWTSRHGASLELENVKNSKYGRKIG